MNDQDNGNDQTPKANPPAAADDDAATNSSPVISGADFEFAEPQLDSAEISADVAESVNLDEVEAEAAEVAREAARSAELPASEIIASVPNLSVPKSGIAFDTPATHGDWDADETVPEEATSVPPRPTTAPEQSVPVASEPEAPTAHLGHSVDDGSGWRRPETQWQPRANAWQSPGQVAQGVVDAAALAAAEESAQRESEPSEPHGPPATSPPQPGVPGVVPIPSYPGQPNVRTQSTPSEPQGPGMPGGPNGPEFPGGSQNAEGIQGPDQGNPGNKNKLFIILGVAVVGVALVVLLIWMLVGLLGGGGKTDNANSVPASTTAATSASDAGADPDLVVAQASPLKWLTGDCLRGFTTVAKAADIVQCNSPHSAQVVGTFKYGVTETFPGADAVKAKGLQVCDAVTLTDAAKPYKDLKTLRGLPTAGSWDTGDRTIQCLVFDPTGENLKTTLL